VVVKTSIVAHGVSGGAPLRAHVAYLARENTRGAPERAPELERQVDYLSREASEGRARYEFYNAGDDRLDAKALTAGWSADARHFRLIISPEDGAALGDLKPMVRELMADLEVKLGARLDWAAVDHWDTDNPHTHVLVRGRRADGQDLIIPNKILTHDLRARAGEIVTRVLGPRPELAPEQALAQAREIGSLSVTPLDRELMSRARHGLLAPPEPGRTDLVGRLQRLEVWGLARRREVLQATGGLLSPEMAFLQRTNACFVRLLADFQRNDFERAKVEKRRDRIEQAAWARGDEACPALAAIDQEIDVLYAAESALSMQMANRPADTFMGVALKLALWRQEAIKSGALGLDQTHDAFAFSAYADALRLSGLQALAHPLDPRTARVVGSGKWTAGGGE